MQCPKCSAAMEKVVHEGVDEVGTRVTLSQDGNDGEDACRHAARQWTKMLDGLKLLVEQKRRSPL